MAYIIKAMKLKLCQNVPTIINPLSQWMNLAKYEAVIDYVNV